MIHSYVFNIVDYIMTSSKTSTLSVPFVKHDHIYISRFSDNQIKRANNTHTQTQMLKFVNNFPYFKEHTVSNRILVNVCGENKLFLKRLIVPGPHWSIPIQFFLWTLV